MSLYFKQTFKLFLESKELGVLRPRPLAGVELKKAKDSAKVCKIVHDFMKDVVHGETTVAKVEALIEKLRPFKLKFAQNTVQRLDAYMETHKDMENSGKFALQNASKFKSHAEQMKAAFLKGDHAKEKRAEFQKDLSKIDAHIDAPKKALYHVKNTFTNVATIFGTTRLLATLSDQHYDQISAIDFSEPLYTTVDFPVSKEHDIDYIVYFLTHLTSSPKPKRVDADHDFRLHSRVKHVNDGTHEKLLKLTEKYLHNNDHALIPEIVALMNSVPEVKAANDKAKKKIKVVYRGLGFGEENDQSEEEIIDEEHKRKYVATSDSRYAAKNFALQKGHLEDKSMRRSAHGYIIEYHVKPDAVVFDTRVIDTVFNESEILIDATKATVASITEV